MSIRIDLPWLTPPVSQNDRQHHHVKAKADIPCERCVFIPTPTGACICREVPGAH